MILFGGIFEITKELNDLHIYNFATNKWSCLFLDDGSSSSTSGFTKLKSQYKKKEK